MGLFPSDSDFGLTNAQDTAVKEVFDAVLRKKAAVMRSEMRESAATQGERRCLRFSDGNGGEVRMMVHPMSYHYWGNRLGYQCWEDAQFCREYLRDNEEARVRNVADNPTVIVQGLGGLASTGKKRFSKTYRGNGETAGRSVERQRQNDGMTK
jgi:hypothetical protein